jgi:hypothetical protein
VISDGSLDINEVRDAEVILGSIDGDCDTGEQADGAAAEGGALSIVVELVRAEDRARGLTEPWFAESAGVADGEQSCGALADGGDAVADKPGRPGAAYQHVNAVAADLVGTEAVPKGEEGTGALEQDASRAGALLSIDLVAVEQLVLGCVEDIDAVVVVIADGVLTCELTGEWDSRRVERVLRNPPRNATKFSPKGSRVSVHVRGVLESTMESSWVEASVQDEVAVTAYTEYGEPSVPPVHLGDRAPQLRHALVTTLLLNRGKGVAGRRGRLAST